MAKRHTLQQLDHMRRNDPEHMLNIIDRRADRNLGSSVPMERFKGQLLKHEVDAARDRMRCQQGL
jgi:hypothetical protein